VPLYYELKLLLIVWLINPGTRGAELLYNKYIWKLLKDYASQWDPTFKSSNSVRITLTAAWLLAPLSSSCSGVQRYLSRHVHANAICVLIDRPAVST
jgi:hypothetical protein